MGYLALEHELRNFCPRRPLYPMGDVLLYRQEYVGIDT